MSAGPDHFCGILPHAAKVELYKQGEWCSPVELFDTEAKFEVGGILTHNDDNDAGSRSSDAFFSLQAGTLKPRECSLQVLKDKCLIEHPNSCVKRLQPLTLSPFVATQRHALPPFRGAEPVLFLLLLGARTWLALLHANLPSRRLLSNMFQRRWAQHPDPVR